MLARKEARGVRVLPKARSIQFGRAMAVRVVATRAAAHAYVESLRAQHETLSVQRDSTRVRQENLRVQEQVRHQVFRAR